MPLTHDEAQSIIEQLMKRAHEQYHGIGSGDLFINMTYVIKSIEENTKYSEKVNNDI